jgi:CubicO group peptidase (beta-lactamase class C family)
MSQAHIGGSCDPRFAQIRAEFETNFRERGELGAAACVTLDGIVVADLWGGWTDAQQRQQWTPATLVNVFSVGKGLLAVCLANLAGRGLLDPGAPVIRYWPEFGAAGKDCITVRQVLSHQAGLPAIRRTLPAGSGLDWALMTSLLAAEEPWWQPGAGHGYHVNTFGYLGGELIRRITGTRAGEFLRREVAGPLGADVHIGLAASDHGRVAEFRWPDRSGETAATQGDPVPSNQMALNAYFNPPDFSGVGVVNTAAWRSAQIPSANAHATAAGVARIYSALAAGGALDGARVVTAGALTDATDEQVYGEDLVLARPSRFGLGFQLTHPERLLGNGPRCYGHFGAGGSVGFCDPDARLAFGYVTNQMGPRWRNPRNKALMDACYASLSAA